MDGFIFKSLKTAWPLEVTAGRRAATRRDSSQHGIPDSECFQQKGVLEDERYGTSREGGYQQRGWLQAEKVVTSRVPWVLFSDRAERKEMSTIEESRRLQERRMGRRMV